MDEDTSVQEETLDTPEEQDEPLETLEDIKARLAKAEELANNYKIRAEKAETKSKEKFDTNLSTADMLAVVKAGVEPEDLGDIIDYAKLKNISVVEALKSNVIKATLATNAELRASALAANTKTVRRASSTISDDQLLENARKGELPDSDEDLKRLVKLRFKK